MPETDLPEMRTRDVWELIQAIHDDGIEAERLFVQADRMRREADARGRRRDDNRLLLAREMGRDGVTYYQSGSLVAALVEDRAGRGVDVRVGTLRESYGVPIGGVTPASPDPLHAPDDGEDAPHRVSVTRGRPVRLATPEQTAALTDADIDEMARQAAFEDAADDGLIEPDDDPAFSDVLRIVLDSLDRRMGEPARVPEMAGLRVVEPLRPASLHSVEIG